MRRAVLLAVLALALTAPLQAAVFTVTKTADTLDGACDHDCSLREAVSAANLSPDTGAGVDVVRVPAGFYHLTRTGPGEDANATGDLDVTGELLLVGAGPGNTVLDGVESDRVLHLQADSEIYGVTIRNGQANGPGGGIYIHHGVLSVKVLLHHIVVQGNRAGEGGGIYVATELVLRESAVLDNHARFGGGIGGGTGGGSARIWLSNVTVANNFAEVSGGGLSYQDDSSVTVAGSTIAFNSAVQTGGGIHAVPLPFPIEEDATLLGSIVAENTAREDPDCSRELSLGYNVIGIAGSCHLQPTDKAGTVKSPLNAHLGVAREGRLGATPVYVLLPGSPALGLVPAEFCLSGDQVGQARSAPCEAGAWELVERPVCVAGGPVLCLQEGRFRVTAGWSSGFLTQGDAQADPLTDDTGNFWFFQPDNLEVMVKVLDGCGLNQRWWVFTSGLTDVGVNLKVEDLETGRIWEHGHASGTTYAPVLDTDAFPCTAIGQASVVSQAVELGPEWAAPAILRVTKTADTFDGACDHDCSLREAVAAANARNGQSVILAGPGVYSLTRLGPFENASATGDLDILHPLVIFGAGAGKTIFDGSGTDRVLHGVGSGTLEVHGVTVRNGWARGSLFDGAGGGIASLYPLTLVDSVVSGNRAEYGGGIWADDLTARGTTISGNIGVDGGGIFGGNVRLTNVTLSGNLGRLGGGLHRKPGTRFDDSEIVNSTVTGNAATVAGGGLYVDQNVDCPADGSCPIPPYIRIFRSVVAGNSAPSKPDCAELENEGGDNVFGVGDSCLTGPTDVAGTLAAPLDPRLSPLGDHGGPTPTHVPLAGSPALDLGPLFGCPAVDQRGRTRPAGAGCDAGSVEFLPSACQPDEETLCLGAGDRFRVTARWTAQGKTEEGKAVPLRLDTGAFWFFDPANVELTVKVLDGCGLNDRYWVFLTGLTDVGVEVEVEDLRTGRKWTHTHAAGTPLQPRLDTNALESCE